MTVDDAVDMLREIQGAGQGSLEIIDDDEHPLLDFEVNDDSFLAVVVSFADYRVGE